MNHTVDLQLPMQSVPITTKVVTSNPVHGEVYSIQHYVTGRWFSPGTAVSSIIKTDITEMLLKVTLNTMSIHVNHPRHDTMDTQNKREHT